MRSFLLAITVIISLGFAALGYLVINSLMPLVTYVVTITLISIGLTFIAGHFFYQCYFDPKHKHK